MNTSGLRVICSFTLFVLPVLLKIKIILQLGSMTHIFNVSRGRQVPEFEASLFCIVTSRPVRATKRDLISTKKKNEKWLKDCAEQ